MEKLSAAEAKRNLALRSEDILVRPTGQDEMKGKVVLITGATSGIGKETAIGLAGMGAKIVMLARNDEKALSVIKEIEERTGNGETNFLRCDLASLASVWNAAQEFRCPI